MGLCNEMRYWGLRKKTAYYAGDPAYMSAIWRPGWHSLPAREAGRHSSGLGHLCHAGMLFQVSNASLLGAQDINSYSL